MEIFTGLGVSSPIALADRPIETDSELESRTITGTDDVGDLLVHHRLEAVLHLQVIHGRQMPRISPHPGPCDEPGVVRHAGAVPGPTLQVAAHLDRHRLKIGAAHDRAAAG